MYIYTFDTILFTEQNMMYNGHVISVLMKQSTIKLGEADVSLLKNSG